jgi:hypothetical protein
MTEIKINQFKKTETLCMTCKKPTNYNYTLIRGNFLCADCYVNQLPKVVKPELIQQVKTDTMVFNILQKDEFHFIIECDERRLCNSIHCLLGDKFESVVECEAFINEYLKSSPWML